MTIHNPERQFYSCDGCGRPYGRSDALRAHLAKGKCVPVMADIGLRRNERVMTP